MKLTENDKEELIKYGSIIAIMAIGLIILIAIMKINDYKEQHTTYYRTDDFIISYTPPAGRSSSNLCLTWTDFNGDTHTNGELILLFKSINIHDTENYIVYTDKFEINELHLTEETAREIGMIREKSASFGEYNNSNERNEESKIPERL